MSFSNSILMVLALVLLASQYSESRYGYNGEASPDYGNQQTYPNNNVCFPEETDCELNYDKCCSGICYCEDGFRNCLCQSRDIYDPNY